MKTVGVILLVCLFQAVAGSVHVPDDHLTCNAQRGGLLKRPLRILDSLLCHKKDCNAPGTGGACSRIDGSGDNIIIPGAVTITGDSNCNFNLNGNVTIGGGVTVTGSDCTVSGQGIVSIAADVTLTSSTFTVLSGSVICILIEGDATTTDVTFVTQNGSETEVNINGALTLTRTICSGSTSTYDANVDGAFTSTLSNTCAVNQQ